MSVHRILIVTQDFFPGTGGIQAYMLELARRFHERGHQVTVLCPGASGTPSPLSPEVEVLRIRVHSSWLFLPLLFRLPRILRAGEFTRVVYAQWQSSLGEMFQPRAARRHRSLCLAHGRELLTSVLGPFQAPLRRWAFRRADAAIPVSGTVETLLRAVLGENAPPSGRVAVIHPGVDPDRFRPGSGAALRERLGVGEDPLILSIARMVPRKGLDLLLHAFARVLATVPDAHLFLGGEGPQEQGLRALARELGVERRVRFLGRVADGALAELYRAATVFALPSRQTARDVEGFGIVFVEAGACEIPVVATDTGGIADAVLHGETGLLVPQENVDALETALLRLLQNPDEAKRMGTRARQRILDGLTWEATGDRFLALMDDLPG